MSVLDFIGDIVEEGKNVCIASCGRSGSHALFYHIKDNYDVYPSSPSEPLLPPPRWTSQDEKEYLARVRGKKRILFICQALQLEEEQCLQTRKTLFDDCRTIKVVRNFYDICSSLAIAMTDDLWDKQDWKNGVQPVDFYLDRLNEKFCQALFDKTLKRKKILDKLRADVVISYEDLPNKQIEKNEFIDSSVHERIREYYDKWRKNTDEKKLR